jgi:hypothetical protein
LSPGRITLIADLYNIGNHIVIRLEITVENRIVGTCRIEQIILWAAIHEIHKTFNVRSGGRGHSLPAVVESV